MLAHELGHIKNRDMLLQTVSATMAGAITNLSRFGMVAGTGDRRSPMAPLAALLAPFAAMIIQFAISRSREYEADHSGAELLGTGEPLARALEKIEAYAKQVPMDVPPAQATAYIVNPLTGRKVEFDNLFTTHPPTAERAARLRRQF